MLRFSSGHDVHIVHACSPVLLVAQPPLSMHRSCRPTSRCRSFLVSCCSLLGHLVEVRAQIPAAVACIAGKGREHSDARLPFLPPASELCTVLPAPSGSLSCSWGRMASIGPDGYVPSPTAAELMWERTKRMTLTFDSQGTANMLVRAQAGSGCVGLKEAVSAACSESGMQHATST